MHLVRLHCNSMHFLVRWNFLKVRRKYIESIYKKRMNNRSDLPWTKIHSLDIFTFLLTFAHRVINRQKLSRIFSRNCVLDSSRNNIERTKVSSRKFQSLNFYNYEKAMKTPRSLFVSSLQKPVRHLDVRRDSEHCNEKEWTRWALLKDNKHEILETLLGFDWKYNRPIPKIDFLEEGTSVGCLAFTAGQFSTVFSKTTGPFSL